MYPSAGYPQAGQGYAPKECPAQEAGPFAFTVEDAWYGTESRHTKVGSRNKPIVQIVQGAVHQDPMGNMMLYVPADKNPFIGVDPLPGVPKVLTLRLRTPDGQEHNVRSVEGEELRWGKDQAYNPSQEPVLPFAFTIEDAWYGTESQHTKVGSGNKSIVKIIEAAGAKRDAIGNMILVIPSDINRFIGLDPLPGVPKVMAVHVRTQEGQDHHIRLREGEELTWGREQARSHFTTRPQQQQGEYISEGYVTPSSYTTGPQVDSL